MERQITMRLKLRMWVRTTRDHSNGRLRLLELLVLLVFKLGFLFHFHKVLEILPLDFLRTSSCQPLPLRVLLHLHVDRVARIIIKVSGWVRACLESFRVLGDSRRSTTVTHPRRPDRSTLTLWLFERLALVVVEEGACERQLLLALHLDRVGPLVIQAFFLLDGDRSADSILLGIVTIAAMLQLTARLRQARPPVHQIIRRQHIVNRATHDRVAPCTTRVPVDMHVGAFAHPRLRSLLLTAHRFFHRQVQHSTAFLRRNDSFPG